MVCGPQNKTSLSRPMLIINQYKKEKHYSTEFFQNSSNPQKKTMLKTIVGEVCHCLGTGKVELSTLRWHFVYDILKCIFLNEKLSILNKTSLECVPKGLIDDRSALVQVMAWCRQATSHYLNQCWPSSMMLGHIALIKDQLWYYIPGLISIHNSLINHTAAMCLRTLSQRTLLNSILTSRSSCKYRGVNSLPTGYVAAGHEWRYVRREGC